MRHAYKKSRRLSPLSETLKILTLILSGLAVSRALKFYKKLSVAPSTGRSKNHLFNTHP